MYIMVNVENIGNEPHCLLKNFLFLKFKIKIEITNY